jgi:Flp pilus assembly protein TadD
MTAASREQRTAFERAAAEYVETQRYNADRAEQDLKAAIALAPLSVVAYVNLADMYRAQGREADAERVLRDGLKMSPNSAPLHHALGLTLVRAKRNAEALAELSRAAKLDPASARFAYVYGVALHSVGRVDEAIATLVKASAAHPADSDILEALASFNRDRGDEIEARRYTEQLRAVAAGLRFRRPGSRKER